MAAPADGRKFTNGPRTDVADVTSFVYYPIDSTVPGPWRGRLAAIRNPAGHIVRFDDYDVFGNATKTTEANGVQHDSTVDTLGRLTASTIKGVPGCDTGATLPLHEPIQVPVPSRPKRSRGEE